MAESKGSILTARGASPQAEILEVEDGVHNNHVVRRVRFHVGISLQ